MSPPVVRPTIREIGLKTGYHYSTVSLALWNHARIPETTKRIIQKAACRTRLPA
jgi:DNA-binding LacI/PurR family transcriptional regulator